MLRLPPRTASTMTNLAQHTTPTTTLKSVNTIERTVIVTPPMSQHPLTAQSFRKAMGRAVTHQDLIMMPRSLATTLLKSTQLLKLMTGRGLVTFLLNKKSVTVMRALMERIILLALNQSPPNSQAAALPKVTSQEAPTVIFVLAIQSIKITKRRRTQKSRKRIKNCAPRRPIKRNKMKTSTT